MGCTANRSYLLTFKGGSGPPRRFDSLEQVVDAVEREFHFHKLNKRPSWDDLYQLFRHLCIQTQAIGRAVPTVPVSYRWPVTGFCVEAAHYRPVPSAASRVAVQVYRTKLQAAPHGPTRVTISAYLDPIPVLYFIQPGLARRRLQRELARLDAVCPGAAALLEPYTPFILECGLRPAHVIDESGSFVLVRLPESVSTPARKVLGTPVAWFDVSRVRGKKVRSVLRAVLQGRIPVPNRDPLPWSDDLAGILLLTLPRLKPFQEGAQQ